MEDKNVRRARNTCERKAMRRLPLPNIQTYYKVSIIKTVWYHAQVDQWNRIENPERPKYIGILD